MSAEEELTPAAPEQAPATTEPPAEPAGLSPPQAWAELQLRFPALFGVGVVLPVKLRIHADIQARAPGVFSRRVLGAVLSRHTTSTAYLKALVRSPHRFDLDGQAAGEIDPTHRQAAQEELERRLPKPRPKTKTAPPGREPRPRAGQKSPSPPRAPRAEPPPAREADGLARLVNAFNNTSLSKANFCALKGISEQALEAAMREYQGFKR